MNKNRVHKLFNTVDDTNAEGTLVAQTSTQTGDTNTGQDEGNGTNNTRTGLGAQNQVVCG